MERELTSPVDIADAGGRLRRDAVGWARHPLLRAHFERGLPRVCAWNYWCITSRTAALTLLVADVGHAGAVLVSMLDYAEGAPTDCVHIRPRGLGFTMPETPLGDVVIDSRRIRLAMQADGDVMRIEARARTVLGARITVDLSVERPPSHETLNVLVPFGDTAFQLTSKQQALPARGVVRVGAREHVFGPDDDGFACLDYGRGRWPRGIAWNWGFASGRQGGRTVGLNFGGKWTDGTGVTENGVVIDGRLHKVGEAVDFDYDARRAMEPWRIRSREGGRVDLRFVPRTRRVVKLPLGVAGVDLSQHMGVYSGTFVDDAGERIALDGMVGLAEAFRARW